MFIEINISTCVFLPRSGGGLRTGASCSWDLEKICNLFAVKGPVRSSSAKLRHLQVTGTLFFPYVSDTELQSSTLVHLIEVSRRALTVGRDRIMQLHKVDKAEKLDGGEGGKRGESLVARTLGV
ncbi:hypothetical protein YC2023_082854 [Brassica napus]